VRSRLKKAGAEKVWAATVARTLKAAMRPVIAENEAQEADEAEAIAASI
jgi:hypothetical protein